MEYTAIQNKTLEVFRKIFGDIPEVNADADADSIHQWDSLNHIKLIQALEQAFGLHFDLFEIAGLRDVKGLTDYISTKLGA